MPYERKPLFLVFMQTSCISQGLQQIDQTFRAIDMRDGSISTYAVDDPKPGDYVNLNTINLPIVVMDDLLAQLGLKREPCQYASYEKVVIADRDLYERIHRF